MEQTKNGAYLWHYRLLIISILFSALAISCKNEKKQETKEVTELSSNAGNDSVKEKKDIVTINKIENTIQKDTVSDEKIKEIRFLKAKGVISSEFNFNNNVVYLNSYYNGKLDNKLMKVVYDETIGKSYMQDPYINFIYVKLGDSLLKTKVLYSIDEEDVNYSFSIDDNIFFEQYDSSTGWKKYYAFLVKRGKFIESDKLDEAENINQSSIDLNSLTYSTDNNKELKKFKVTN